MAYTISQVTATGLTMPDNTAALIPVGGFIELASEANVQSVFRSANGTFDKSGCFITANDVGSASTLTLRVNGADTLLVISITASTTGLFEDTTHSAAINSTDKVNWRLFVPSVPGSHSVTLSHAFARFSSATDTYQKFLAFQSDAGATYGSVTRSFPSLNTYLVFGTGNESTIAHKFYTAGTLQKAQCYLSANTRDSTTTLSSRINGVDGTVAVSITASTSGLFEDTTHSDAVAVNDLINMGIIGTVGTGSGTFDNVGMEFVTTNKKSHMFFAYANTPTRSGVSETSYLPLSSGNIFAGAENREQYKSRFTATVTNLQILISTNLMTTAGTFDFRLGGVSQALTTSVTALTTGLFEDATNSVVLAIGDLVNYRFISGATAGADINQVGCMIEDTTTVAGSATVPLLMLMGVG